MMETLSFCCIGDGSGSLMFDEKKDRFQCKVCSKIYDFSDDGFVYYKIHSIWQMMDALISTMADIMSIRSVESYYIIDDNDEFIYARAKRFSFGAMRLALLLMKRKGFFLIEKRNHVFSKK